MLRSIGKQYGESVKIVCDSQSMLYDRAVETIGLSIHVVVYYRC